jgi:hypothetical protein
VNEAEHKADLVKEVKLLGGYAQRVEDKWAVGILDLILKFPGHDVVMAECKMIKGNLFAPTSAQYAKGVNWLKAGVGVALIGWQDKTMYISPWVKQADKRDCWMTNECNEAEFLAKYVAQMPLCFMPRELNAENQNSTRS